VPKFFEPCPYPGCTKTGNFCRGFCSSHYLKFRKDCIENCSWGSGAPLAHPIVIEHWEWHGDEDSLAEICEQQEQLREQREAPFKQENDNG